VAGTADKRAGRSARATNAGNTGAVLMLAEMPFWHNNRLASDLEEGKARLIAFVARILDGFCKLLVHLLNPMLAVVEHFIPAVAHRVEFDPVALAVVFRPEVELPVARLEFSDVAAEVLETLESRDVRVCWRGHPEKK
jgi:hypothetical protein